MKELLVLRTSLPPSYGLKGLDLIYATLDSLWNNPISLLIFIGLFIFGMYRLYRDFKYIQHSFLFSLFTVFVGSIILSYMIPILPRYLIVALPLFTIPAAYYMNVLKDSRLYIAILFLFAVASASVLYPYFTTQSRDDWRGLTDELNIITQDGDTIIVIPAYNNQPIDFYYSNTTDGTFKYGVSTLEDLNAIHKSQNTYYIISPDILAIPDGQTILKWLNSNTQPKYKNGNLFILRNL
jgi:hypothetical protein